MTTIETVLRFEDAKIPTKAHPNDAGFDLYAYGNYVLEPQQKLLIDTGINICIPINYFGLIVPRSGISFTTELFIANTPGTIDAGYIGELKIICKNNNESYSHRIWSEEIEKNYGSWIREIEQECVGHEEGEIIKINHGDRIAQLIILPVPEVIFKQVEVLPKTERADSGFGSSGE